MRRAAVAMVLIASAALARDVAVDRDGKIYKGDAEVTLSSSLLVIGRRKIPLTDVHIVEKGDGTLIYAPDLEARLRGYEYLARDHVRDRYVKLVREATQVSDFALARMLLERAERAGLASKEAVKLKIRIERQVARNPRKAARSARVAKKAVKLHRYFGEMLAQRAQKAFDGGTGGAWLLREALRRVPDSALALELLAKASPGNFPIGDDRTWLEWHLDLESAGARITQDEPALLRARRAWRKDLHAVLAEPIVVISPVKDSQLIGRCLAYSRLSCSALKEMFATDAPRRAPTHPLTVFLFSSKEEYLTRSGTGRPVHDAAALEWTTGHYSPSEGISRFYWYTDRDAERRIAGTCVHELTHHWLAEHNPRIAGNARTGDQAGYWVVEGFATLMEEGVFDIDSGKWDLFNPRARSLDVLQSIAGSRYVIPWDRYYALDQLGFMRLPRDDRITVVMRWRLRPGIMSTTRLFYEQAAATCQFLYHGDGGRHREKLLDYVVNYYAGNKSRLNPRAAFSMSGADLGRRTEQFARSVAAGWTPK